ncbi:hypothetical protein L596_025153 [Steinernema carpocapsae]|uniref:Uncharacterized protein n=1 Tax=Steinernema carpocapsae TaxID=34508 RepID=A0A4U5M6Z4_STECR|nr:hypothetical protein L596_025153 [Steinernema carpocapsae]
MKSPHKISISIFRYIIKRRCLDRQNPAFPKLTSGDLLSVGRCQAVRRVVRKKHHDNCSQDKKEAVVESDTIQFCRYH